MIVVTGCLLLQFLPSATLTKNIKTREVDLLADIRETSERSETSKAPSMGGGLGEAKRSEKEILDSCAVGFVLQNTYLHDYSALNDSNALNRGISIFYKQLLLKDSLDRPIRIAYFGDSFIEGDILTEDLRTLLQKKFGGSGAGYVYVHHPVAHLRNSVVSRQENWSEHCLTDKHKNRELLGVDGMYFQSTAATAWMSIKAISSHDEKRSNKGNMSAFYYRTQDNINVVAEINGQKTKVCDSIIGKYMTMKMVRGNIKEVKWVVNSLTPKPAVAYGATMETQRGICLDNFGIRSTNGMQFATMNDSIAKDFFKERQYDLIILGYGLNMASSEAGANYSSYMRVTEKGIRKITQYAPNAAILVVSIGDRARRTGKGLESYPSSTELANCQRNLARKLGCCFWDLNKTMLSLGGAAEMAEQKPSLVSKDYTHINGKGGETIAKRLYKDLLDGYKQYAQFVKEKKNEYAEHD